MSLKKPSVVVVGDGWAALGAVAFLASDGAGEDREVRWIAGTGARIAPPLPALASGPGVAAWSALAKRVGLDVGEVETGVFLREFRNKAFREPSWVKEQDVTARDEAMAEGLWGGERRFTGAFEVRFEQTLAEIEEAIRARLTQGAFPGVRRTEGVPVTGVKIENGQVRGVTLASGEEIACERLYYADRWSALPRIEGIPTSLPFLRNRELTGVLQVTFTHDSVVGAGISEGFHAALPRDAGEERDRHIFGGFSTDGTRSHWTLCLDPDEVENNHEIAKKLRRMRATLDKMFQGPTWLPEGKTEFTGNVRHEQVRFEEAIMFTDGEPPVEPITLKRLEGAYFLTDGYGPSSALHQISLALDQ
jgi:hypothetical protein